MKKLISLMLVVLMVMTLALGCAKTTNTDGNSTQSNAGEGTENTSETLKHADLNINFLTFVPEPADLKLVEDEINKITEAKINVTVHLKPYSVATYRDQMKLQLVSNEKVDLLLTGNLGIFDLYINQVANGLLYPMNDLLSKYGQGIVQALGDTYAYAGSMEGKTYGVPQNRDLAQGWCFLADKGMADKYGIKATELKTFDKDFFDNMFKTIKENESKVYPFFPGETPATLVDNLNRVDPLDNYFGVLENLGMGDTKVVDFYETQEYRDLVTLAKEWADKGYIYSEAATTEQTPYELLSAGRIFGFFSTWKPGIEGQSSRRAGKDLIAITFDEPWSFSGKVTNFMWSIAHNCEAPEQAMRMLNLMYTDKDIMNLLAWGIEDKHYVKVAGKDNVITYPEGVNSQNSGYNLQTSWMFGNEMLCYVWEGDPDNLRSAMDEFNKNARKSKALGFTFDTTNVSTEIASLTNVQSQYKRMLENGFVDNVDKTLNEFISKLKQAGIDKVVTEKQKQLDAWLSSK